MVFTDTRSENRIKVKARSQHQTTSNFFNELLILVTFLGFNLLFELTAQPTGNRKKYLTKRPQIGVFFLILPLHTWLLMKVWAGLEYVRVYAESVL